MGSADRPRLGRRRSAARLAAVQALYEMDVAGAAADPVLGEFIGQRWKRSVEDEPPLSDPDEAFLSGLVRGTASRAGELDALIAPALSKDWSLDRLEVLLRSILRAGTFELLALDTPTKVVITEYLDVAHAFFSGNEPALVNAVLDRVATVARAPEAGRNDDGRPASGE